MIVAGVSHRLHVHEYSPADWFAVGEWLAERVRGYPKRDLPWPPDDAYARAHRLMSNGERFKATCCKCGRVDWMPEPVRGVYFCGYGCT